MSTRRLALTMLYLVAGIIATDYNRSSFGLECFLVAVLTWLGFALLGRILA